VKKPQQEEEICFFSSHYFLLPIVVSSPILKIFMSEQSFSNYLTNAMTVFWILILIRKKICFKTSFCSEIRESFDDCESNTPAGRGEDVGEEGAQEGAGGRVWGGEGRGVGGELRVNMPQNIVCRM